MSPQSTDNKEHRRKILERKKLDKQRILHGHRDPKLHERVVETKTRGGSKNLTRFYEDYND